MGLTNDSLIDTVFERFPEKRDIPEQGDEIFVNWNFQDFQDGGYLNFKADRSDLFALSIMIENYASKHTAPLLASFETDKRYEFVKDRYLKLMKKLPRTWIIGNFNNPHLAQDVPDTCQVLSCIGTPLSTVWAVVTKGPDGPIGLVAEEYGIGKFKGFFSTQPDVVQAAVDAMGEILVTKFDFNKKEYGFAKGGPLEKYNFDLKFEDENHGKNNTVFLEPVAIKNGYWGFHGGREIRQLFMMQVQSKGYKFMTSFAMRDVIDERKKNEKNVVFVKKFDPERWDYFRVTL